MTTKYVIPTDTQQWLSGIGARLPRSENDSTDQLAASDHHTCEDGEQAAVVDLDDHDALGADADLGDDPAARNLAGAQPSPEPTADSDPACTSSDQPGSQPQTQAFDVGTAAAQTPPDDPHRPSTRRFKPWVVGALVAATAVATLITATMTFVNTPSPPPALTSLAPSTSHTAPPPPPAPTTAAAGNENTDAPLPFTASSDCDNAGSTPAQSVAEPNADNPWVCVLHGAGQVLTLQLGQPAMPQAYVITGISIIPGAIGPQGRRPSDPDPWLAHRVVTLLQWHFSDPANLFLDQNTFNHRGEVPMAVPRVLASKITIIIRQTSRPPTDDPSPTTTADLAGGVSAILGPPPPASTTDPALPGADNTGHQTTDPSDGTFAVASIKVFGHKAV